MLAKCAALVTQILGMLKLTSIDRVFAASNGEHIVDLLRREFRSRDRASHL